MDKNGRISRLLSRFAGTLILAVLFLCIGCPNKITVKPETFAVTFSAGEHGTLKAKADGVTETDKSPISVEKDKTVTFTAKPADGYEVEKWTVNGTAVANNVSTTYSYKVTAKIEVKVLFKALPPATVAVTEVKLDKSELTLEAGKSEQLTATVLPDNATNKTVTWSSDKSDIASVDANGKVTANKAGKAVITVKTKDGAQTASCTVTVTPTTYKVTFSVDGTGGTLKAKADGIAETDKSPITIEQGKTVTFTATPADANHKVKEWKLNDTPVNGTEKTYSLKIEKEENVQVSFKGLADGHAWYKVEHYQENIDGTYPSTPEGIEEDLSGAKGTSLSIGSGITLKGYSGFEFDKLEPAVPTIAADGSTVVKVLYKRKTINVTFKLDGGNIDGNTGDVVKTGKYGTPLNAPNNPARDGHVFKGWSPKLTATFPDHDSEYTAQWAVIHTVTFSVDGIGGTLKAKADDSELHTGDKVEQGKTVTFTATADEGYKIETWSISGSSFESESGTDGSTTAKMKVTANTTVQVTFKLDDFVTITPPASGITGMDPDPASLPGTRDYWKGVFREGRKVKLSPYKLGKTEVPYKLWKEVYDWATGKGYTFANEGLKGKLGSGTEKDPVTWVSWRDCIVWCNAYTQKMNTADTECVYRKKDDHTAVLKDATDGAACDAAYAEMGKKGYRLPTEAEWEYAARWQGSDSTNADKYGEVWLTKLNSASGAKGKWDTSETGEVAWYGEDWWLGKTHPVGKKRANALGLHDMSGNVWEWCFDWYDNIEVGDVTDPQGAASGRKRVIRGGSWGNDVEYCLVGFRNDNEPDGFDSFVGFRWACRP